MSTGSDFVCATFVKARAPHLCVECGGRILPGQIYSRHVQVYEGQFDRLSFCRKCAVLWNLLLERPWWKEWGVDEWSYGQIEEYIRGHAIEQVLWSCRQRWKASEAKEATA